MIKLTGIILSTICLFFISCEFNSVNPNETEPNISENLNKQDSINGESNIISFQDWLTGDWSIDKIHDVLEEVSTGEMDTFKYELDANDSYVISENELAITWLSNGPHVRPYQVISNDSLIASMIDRSPVEDYYIVIDSLSHDNMILTEYYPHTLEMMNDDYNLVLTYELTRKD